MTALTVVGVAPAWAPFVQLKTGSEVELPFWLLRDLAIRGFVSLQRPKFFSVKYDSIHTPLCLP